MRCSVLAFALGCLVTLAVMPRRERVQPITEDEYMDLVLWTVG